MIPLEDAVTARLESHGERFEVLIDPDAALEMKRGEFEGELEDVIAAEDVFENASRGDRPAESALEEVFGTTDPLEIIPEVVERGEIQITAEQRKEMEEQKHNALINKIARNAVNPQMDNLDALRPVIPIRFDEVTVAVNVPADYAGSAQAKIRQYGDLEREEWQADGSWIGVVTFPAGMQNDFYDMVNEETSGEAETRIVKEKDDLKTR